MKYIMTALIVLVSAGYSQAETRTVLFDQGHGQLFTINEQGALDLTRLATVLAEQGFTVEATGKNLSGDLLADVDVLIISGAFSSPGSAELQAIDQFINNGGQLLVMLHVGPLVAPLLQQLNVAVSRAVIHDTLHAIDGHSSDFNVRLLAGHPVFEGIDSFKVYGSWALQGRADNVRVMAMTSPSAWLDMQRNQIRGSNPQGRFPIMVQGQVGKGNFIVFGDDAIFQNKFLVGSNLALARNLAGWLENQALQQVNAD